jgi:signal transduction histidine kinase
LAELVTEFASPHRAAPQELEVQSRAFREGVLFRQLLDRLPDMVMILNPDRQVVYANAAVLERCAAPGLAAIAGLRPGELFHCKHSSETPGGCGTTRFCSYCGAVNAILQAQGGQMSVQECRMTVATERGEESLDLRVWASPMRMDGRDFTFFVVADIADEKRRLWLEKIFLHDLMNSATALRGFSWLLASGEVNSDFIQRVGALADRIVEEIESHRQLVAAENGELQLQLSDVNPRQAVADAFAAYNHPDLLNGRRLRMEAAEDSRPMRTDRTLLARVLGNMTKNAIEGSVPGEAVTLGCRWESGHAVFWVHNPTYIPENVRLQIFNRSFSTKGAGRGLGTYSMKFLTERYLGGHIEFTSTETSGTVFHATYPAELKTTA